MRSRVKGDDAGSARRPFDDSTLRLPDQRGHAVSIPAPSSTSSKGSRIRKPSSSRSDPMVLVMVAFTSTFVLCTIYLLVHDNPSAPSTPQEVPPLPSTATVDRSAETVDGPALFASTPARGDGSFCRYDGHCGTLRTCAVAQKGRGGFCEPFTPKGSTKSAASKKCLDTCLKELQIDEHWYQEQWPVVDWSEDVTNSQGRPDGCMIVYHREPQGERFKYLEEQDQHEKSQFEGIPPSLVNWVNTRFHHIKRVDPLNDDELDNRWVALCTSPCTSDADCVTHNDGTVPGFVCREAACVRNPMFWGPDLPAENTPHDQMESAADMVLVTGATDGYFSGLTNLAASARYWAPQYKMVVYNLGGISPENIAKIRSWSNVLAVEWENGVPDQYPPHVSEGKVYAWKPIIVNETVHKYGSIFWLDSGSTLAGPVQPVQKALQHQGIALMKGQDLDMRPKSFGKTYEWFGFDKQNMAVGPHFSGNTQAFMYPSRYVDAVVIPNCKCALDANCIKPPGSSLSNHRYDQTTISILAYKPKVRLPHYTEFLAADQGQLNHNLLKPSFKFVWTARNGCSFYSERDPELKGSAPDGGYFHYLPKASDAAQVKGRPNSVNHGPESMEGGEEIPDEHHLVRGAANTNNVRRTEEKLPITDDRLDAKQRQEIQNGEEKALWNNERVHLARLEQVRKANSHG